MNLTTTTDGTTIMGQQDRNLGDGTGEPGFGTNSGIFIGGANSGVVASGHARITQINHGTNAGDPLEMIDRLLRQLEADASVLDSDAAEDVIDDAHRLHTEVHSRKLSTENIRAVLSRLSAATTSTATLLATVDQIKDLVTVLLH
jgi:hypothetical protein